MSSLSKRATWLLVGTAIALTPSRADAGASEAAAAEVLFKQARELVSSNKFEEACPKFEESQRLDPGMGTLYNLADCFTHIGRHASAWAAFTEVADSARQAGQKEREEDARRRAASEEKQLSYLTVKVAKPTPGLELTRDGVQVGKGQIGARVPVDDGDHTFRASAPKKIAWEKVIPVRGEAVVEIPELADAPVVNEGPMGTKETVVIHDRGATQRILAYSLMGVGGVGLVMGGIFGLNAISKKNQSNEAGGCSSVTNTCTTPEGVELRDEGRTAGTLSTVFFIGGAAFAGAGIVTLILAPKRVEERVKETKTGFRPVLAPSVFGGAFEGSF